MPGNTAPDRARKGERRGLGAEAMGVPPLKTLDEIKAHCVVDDNGCWLWCRRLDRHGYGEMRRDKRKVGVHRAAYELAKGPVPDGLVIDHLCRVRRCANPDHMEPVTNAENLRRGKSRERSHCVHGHPFADENLRFAANGKKICVTCQRARSNRAYARRMGART